MRHVFRLAILIAAVCGAVAPAFADDGFTRPPWLSGVDAPAHADPWAVNWATVGLDAPADVGSPLRLSIPLQSPVDHEAGQASSQAPNQAADQATTGRRRVVAVEYSDAYKLRNKIHKIASYATLPLFAAEYWAGAYMYANPVSITPALQSTHRALGISLGGLFAVNTVTGVWNLWDGRKDPNHRGRRMLHGLTMLAADAGFAISGAMRPSLRGGVDNYYHQRMVHRAVATTSMVVAGVSYLMMLVHGGQ